VGPHHGLALIGADEAVHSIGRFDIVQRWMWHSAERTNLLLVARPSKELALGGTNRLE